MQIFCKSYYLLIIERSLITGATRFGGERKGIKFHLKLILTYSMIFFIFLNFLQNNFVINRQIKKPFKLYN